MTELPRLLDHSDDDFERALLGSVRAERPRASGLRDTALAVGLTTSTAEALAATLPATSLAALGAHTAAAPLGSAGTAGAGAVSTVAASASVTVLGKGLLGGALVTLLGLTAVDHLATPAALPRSPASLSARDVPGGPEPGGATGMARVPTTAPAAIELTPPPTPEPRAVSGAHRSSPQPELEPPGAIAAPRPRSTAPANAAFAPITSPASSSPASVGNPSLADEIRQLDRARAALAAGDAAAASQALDVYASRRPSPTLAQEAALLRVRILLAQGQRPAAAALARRIIVQHPQGAHVESLRSLASEP